jgi:hypothetical protein
LLAKFLREFNEYGINIKADINEKGKIIAPDSFFKRITKVPKTDEYTGLTLKVPVE